MTQLYYVFDIETYPNCFLFCGKFTHLSDIQLFEISDRRNEREALVTWLSYLRNVQCEMVGFNNLGFDYPIIHELIINPYQFTYEKASQMANNIIAAQTGFNNFKGIGIQNRVIPQIDLMKVCHFDNANKRTSLKQLQFAMRSESLEDLPFEIRDLTDQEKDVLREYNIHDVTETEKFFKRHEHVINMRREYVQDGVLSGDVLNFSDVKIGTEYLISKIGKYNCYAGGKPRQTLRYQIFFNKIILPKIYFRTEPFQNVLTWFRKQVIDVTSKEEKPSLEAKLAGLDFHFGVGGVHASAENKIFHTDDEYQIIDIDVTGMYVSVAIANSFAPEHLGENYSRSYRQLKEDRARYPKGSSMNAALKLAGNGAYGNSNNAYSPFYDPQYTFSVTVNGQLQILQLVELIDLLPDCEIIQANTDGITVRLKKINEPFFKLWCDEWEKMTGLALEYVKYNRMWIKDVNSYLAEYQE